MKKVSFKKALVCALALITMVTVMTSCDDAKGDVKDREVSPSTVDSLNDEKANPLDLVGIWQEVDENGAKTLIIKEDGSFSLEYKGSVAVSGTVKVESEEHPDGSKSVWFSFYAEDGKLWEAFPFSTEENPQNNLWSGQDGELHFIRDTAVD